MIEPGGDQDGTRIDVFLDGEETPMVSHRPPARFELDTSALADGPHTLRVEAYDSKGHRGVRTIRFTVRNGPGIAVNGLADDDVIEGKFPILVNSYGGAGEPHWEPAQAETPAPIPTWIWVMCIVIVAFAVFYGVREWAPPPDLAATPTYSSYSSAERSAPDRPPGEADGKPDRGGPEFSPGSKASR